MQIRSAQKSVLRSWPVSAAYSAERQGEIIRRRIVTITRISVTEGSAVPG